MSFDYQIELRNKSGTLLQNLKEYASRVSWRYDAKGGCGDCEIILDRDFDDYGDVALDYGIEIYETVDAHPRIGGSTFSAEFGRATFAGGGALGSPLPGPLPMMLLGVKKLRYSGFIREIKPSLSAKESVRLGVSGYSRQMEYVSVTKKTAPLGPVNYASLDVGEIARQVFDTYVAPGTQIRRTAGLNLVQNIGVSVSATGLDFDGSAWEVFETLATIGANAEWGVTADKEIYFLPRSASVKQTWNIGNYVAFFEPSVGSTDHVVHTVYLTGAGGYRRILNLASAQPGYYKERNILVPSIADDNDATLWGTGFAARFAAEQSAGRLQIAAIDVEKSGLSNFIENYPNQSMPPLGLLRVTGGPSFLRAGAALPLQLPAQLTAASVGGITNTSFRINSISYTPIDGGLAIDIELGEKSSSWADLFRTIDWKLSDLRRVAA